MAVVATRVALDSKHNTRFISDSFEMVEVFVAS
jgi:hypothetical protein